MSNNKEQTVRLLKANNVQRRYYVKEVDVLADQASRKNRANLQHKRAVIYNQHVEKAMGAELLKLIEIRAQIQVHKQAIFELKTIIAEPIRRRLNKRGLMSGEDNTSYGQTDYLEFYTCPPTVDKKSENVCELMVGNPMVQLRMMECSNNPPYAKYEEAITSVEAEQEAFDNDVSELRRQIWGVVSTQEILELISAFKAKWL